MLIKCGNIDVSKRVTSCEKKIAFSDKRIIGQVPSMQLDLKLNNKDDFFNDKLNELFYYTEYGSNRTLVFVAYEQPERYTKELTLKLYDRSYELDVAYDTKLDYKNNQLTILDQLAEMEMLTGFSIDVSTIPSFVLSKVIKWYDNTITIRTYLGWIAELFGANVFADGENTFKFIGIGKLVTHSPTVVSDYQKGSLFKISRVCFDNSVIKAEKGNEENNTLYVSCNNMYVEDDNKDEVVDYIYSNLNGLEVYSLDNMKTKNLIDLLPGHIVNYKNEFNAMVIDISSKVTTATSFIMNLKGEMVSKNEEKQINKIDNTTRIRALKVVFDQEKLKWSVTAKEVEGQNEKIGQLEVGLNGISAVVGSVKEENDTIVENANKLQLAVDSLTNQFITTGGNNLLKDSFGAFYDGWLYEKKYHLNTSIDIQKRNDYGVAILLVQDTITQTVQLPDGEYTLSFTYCKHVSLSDVKVIIDDVEYALINTDYTKFEHKFTVKTASFKIQFRSDTDDSCSIVNLMLNKGNSAAVWSLSQGESYSENFQLSKQGMMISNNISNTALMGKNDKIGFINKSTGEYTTTFTDVGILVKDITVKNKMRLLSLLYQEVNGQVGVFKMGSDN